jgi:uncharacterized protein (UPF0218 family)
MPSRSGEENLTTQSMKTSLSLPVHMRQELKTPIGELVRGDPSVTVELLRKRLKEKNPPSFAVVGDFTTKNILDAGLNPDIYIVDHRVMRNSVEPLSHKGREVLHAINPASTITSSSWKRLEKAVSLKREASIIVEGEEDLLVLPLISLLPIGSLIVYGQPREGMVLVEVTDEMKGWAEGFMARMEEI